MQSLKKIVIFCNSSPWFNSVYNIKICITFKSPWKKKFTIFCKYLLLPVNTSVDDRMGPYMITFIY